MDGLSSPWQDTVHTQSYNQQNRESNLGQTASEQFDKLKSPSSRKRPDWIYYFFFSSSRNCVLTQ
jgi:hypothetical protein